MATAGGKGEASMAMVAVIILPLVSWDGVVSSGGVVSTVLFIAIGCCVSLIVWVEHQSNICNSFDLLYTFEKSSQKVLIPPYICIFMYDSFGHLTVFSMSFGQNGQSLDS